MKKQSFSILLLWVISALFGVYVGKTFLRAAPEPREEPAKQILSSDSSASESQRESHHDKLVREAAFRTQTDFDQGISYPPMDDHLTTFEKGWKISNRLSKRLALSRRERKAAQAAIDQSRASLESLVKANLVQLDDSGHEFLVKPFMKEGHSELARLQTELRTILPADVGEELFKYFRWRPHLGSFGANEVRIKVTSPDVIQFTKRHSMTGKTITNYVCTESQLLDYEGLSLSILKR